jgi:hypothetical protein
MTETTERFLQEIATRVGHDRVAELYLFPVLRQGGVEGAVAVVAAYPEGTGEESATVPAVDAAPLDAPELDDAGDATQAEGAEAGPGSSEPIESAPFDAHSTEAEPAKTGADVSEQRDVPSAALAPRPRARHVVYTARYRHTVKGTDRGRWAVEVVAEADAPLITIEEVVRGVVRRSGDAFQPERISGDQFRAIVPAPAAPGSAPA